MKKMKQIVALLGIIFLVLLYILTLIAAIFDTSATMKYLAVSIVATVLIPVTLWLFLRMTEMHGKNKKDKE